MKKLLSFDTLTQAIRQCTRRFPATVGFIVMQTAYLLLVTWGSKDLLSDRVEMSVNYYLATGIILTIVIQLWGEEIKNRHTLAVTNAVAHTALLADAVYLYATYDNINMEVFLAHTSVLTALSLCMFILPFFRERDDIASWNFTLRLIDAGVSSFFLGGIMCGGICLLTTAVRQLFDFGLPNDLMQTWCILFLFTLPSLLFIGRIPAEGGKHNRMPVVSAFLNKSIRFLLLPLLGCYLLVLYVYLARILILWQLPDGWVSKLVSVLTIGSIGVVFGLYPSIRQGTSVTDRRVVRFLPLAIIPLLVLMTVGIARRLNDYGITVNRLYILTLNIWYYIVCIGLYASRASRVWWITASFAALFLFTSVLPVNITNYTHKRMYRHVEAAIKDNYNGKLPMSEEAYYDFIAGLPPEEAQQLNSRLKYLDWELRDKAISTLVPNTINWWRATNYIEDRPKGENSDAESEWLSYCSNACNGCFNEMELGNRYAALYSYNGMRTDVPRPKDRTLQLPIYKGEQSAVPIDTVEIRMDDLRKWSALNNYTPHTLPCQRHGNTFVLTEFCLQGQDTLTLIYSGYYLMQQQTKTDNNE